MSRGKVKIAWIDNQRARKAGYKKKMQGLVKKAHELTILCNMTACLIFFSRDDNNLVVWPSREVAMSLMDRFFSLPHLVRSLKAVDQESFIKENIKKLEKKLADARKVNFELEMDYLMFQLQMGRRLVDLSDTEIDKLIAYSNNKIFSLKKEIDSKQNPNHEPSLGVSTPRAWNVASGLGGNSFTQMGSGSTYLVDQWIFNDPNVQNNVNEETLLPSMLSHFNLNSEASDGEDMEICKGESSKSGGSDDA